MLLFNMHLLLLVLMGAFVGMAAAQGSCDPQTQYQKDGECCLKCMPGTSMSSDTCKKPQCEPCGENEYQDEYTRETKCQRQPYCDPNKNFEERGQKSKTERFDCRCKYGFHCSTEDCLTCVEHTVCEPGFWAKSIGNRLSDTVCEKCPNGRFSDEASWNGVCRNWTICAEGAHVEERGTATSDNKCASSSRGHIIIIVIAAVAVVALAVVFIIYQGCIKRRAKGYFKPELCQQVETPQMVAEAHVSMTPEENEDDHSHELSSEGLTEKGNCVMQERGKEEIMSRQESQLDSQLDSQEDSRRSLEKDSLF